MQTDNYKISYIDLFAGAGGLSEGFSAAGFQSVAHVEMDKDACNTLKTRESYYYLKFAGKRKLYQDYLEKRLTREDLYSLIPEDVLNSVICETMSEDTMPSVFKRIDAAMLSRNVKHINIILGGPPCQAYSLVGRSRKNMNDDPRNNLYELYFRAIEKYQPDMFVFENVPGLLNAGEGVYLNLIVSGFEKRGYDLEHHILNAADFGVLQSRRRIILIGWKKGTSYYYPKLGKYVSSFTVADLLNDLPPITPGMQADNYEGAPGEYLSETKIRESDDILTWHIARPNLERDRKIYRLAIEAWQKERRRLKYTDIPAELATHKNRRSFLDRFKVVAADLPTAQTMVAHIAKDGHYYIHPDINQARSLSVREAARIQSFPDNYYFEGSRTAVFKQIGNAVPPLLAKTLAEAIQKQFGGI